MAAAGVRGDLTEALHEHFGLPAFRPLQREIIGEVLAGRSCLGVLPTGGGKSLCYQLPAMVLPGVTLVVSPLISLMKDQVDALVTRGKPALALTSHDTAAEGRAKLEALAAGAARLVFAAPERLRGKPFLEACRRTRVSLLAVDEAHCVSQWGHDFRPDYRSIRHFRSAIGAPPLLALTATATPRVRDDIATQLGIPEARKFVASADRPNLWLGLERCATQADRQAKVAYLAARTGGSTILYVTSRRDAEAWAERLGRQLGEPVEPYHAGMPADRRTAVQNRFMAGLTRIVAATTAFGMGIDKPDIRAVIHVGVPPSPEAYFQEIGRAGRDGLPAACAMVLVPGADVRAREYLLEKDAVPESALKALLGALEELERRGGGRLAADAQDQARSLALSYLQEMGTVEVLHREADGYELRVTAPLTDAARRAVAARLAEQELRRRERFRHMKRFVYLDGQCRRAYLLRYFGESLAARPGACCSTCHPRPLPEGLTPGAAPARRTPPDRRQAPRTRPEKTGAARAAPPHPAGEAILERLRRWRREKAAALGVPAFVVFGDRDLASIAAAAPRTLDELAACRGVGPFKLGQYGAEILAEVAAAAAPGPSGLPSP